MQAAQRAAGKRSLRAAERNCRGSRRRMRTRVAAGGQARAFAEDERTEAERALAAEASPRASVITNLSSCVLRSWPGPPIRSIASPTASEAAAKTACLARSRRRDAHPRVGSTAPPRGDGSTSYEGIRARRIYS